MGDLDPGLKERLKTIESAMVSLVKEERSGPLPARQPQKQEACRESGTARAVHFLVAGTATRAAAAGATTRPASAALGPRRASGDYQGQQHQAACTEQQQD